MLRHGRVICAERGICKSTLLTRTLVTVGRKYSEIFYWIFRQKTSRGKIPNFMISQNTPETWLRRRIGCISPIRLMEPSNSWKQKSPETFRGRSRKSDKRPWSPAPPNAALESTHDTHGTVQKTQLPIPHPAYSLRWADLLRPLRVCQRAREVIHETSNPCSRLYNKETPPPNTQTSSSWP